MRVSAVLAAPAKAHIRFRYGVRRAAASSSSPSAAAAAPAASSAAGSSAAATDVTLRRALTDAEIVAVNSGIAWV